MDTNEKKECRKIYRIITVIILIIMLCFVPKEIEKIENDYDFDEAQMSIPGYSGTIYFSHGFVDPNTSITSVSYTHLTLPTMAVV